MNEAAGRPSSDAPGAARVIAYLGLGSNLGDRAHNIVFGVSGLAALPETVIESVSSLYETTAWGVTDQPSFLNCCLSLSTRLTAMQLLEAALAIETAAGRQRRERWGPRTLDIDLLFFGDAVISEPRLSVPHPALKERAFVLVPLVEIAPDLTLDGVPLARVLAGLDASGVRRLGPLEHRGAQDE